MRSHRHLSKFFFVQLNFVVPMELLLMHSEGTMRSFEKERRREIYPGFLEVRGRSDWVDSMLTELIFDTVESSEPSESTSSPGVSFVSARFFTLFRYFSSNDFNLALSISVRC